MTALQLTNLGPLIAASEAWVQNAAHQFWLANDAGKAKLVETRPQRLFAHLEYPS